MTTLYAGQPVRVIDTDLYGKAHTAGRIVKLGTVALDGMVLVRFRCRCAVWGDAVGPNFTTDHDLWFGTHEVEPA